MLARLGVRVTLLYRDRLPLRGFDEDLRTRLAAALTQAGIELQARAGADARRAPGRCLAAGRCRRRHARRALACSTRPAGARTPPTLGLDAAGHRHRCRAVRCTVDDRCRTAAAARVRDRRRDQPHEPDAGGDCRRPRVADPMFGRASRRRVDLIARWPARCSRCRRSAPSV